MRRLTCPTCKKSVPYENETEVPERPFCSERCRLVDLGKWFTEQYRIIVPAEAPPEDKPRTGGE